MTRVDFLQAGMRLEELMELAALGIDCSSHRRAPAPFLW
jgi:hypothetical protein